MELIDLVKNAKESTYKLQSLNTEIKNYALSEIAKNIEKRKSEIFEANNKDLENAKKLLNNKKISLSMFNRLKLDDNKMIDIISGIKDVIKLEEPINKILTETELDDNLILKKVSCPIGLIAVIFEARPDVISQISSLCIKSSNAVILKGGSEGENTNKIIFEIINQVLSDIKEFPKNSVNLVFSREDIKNILSMDKYIDLIIPRGSNDLVQYMMACDRTNEKLSGLYNPIDISVLRMLKHIIDVTNKANKKVAICGEMGSVSKYAPVLLGLGIREISMSITSIAKIKNTIRAVSIKECEDLINAMLEKNDNNFSKSILNSFMNKINIKNYEYIVEGN